MNGHARGASRYESLRASRVVLGRIAPLVRMGLFGVGLSLFLGQTRTLISDAQFTWGERYVLGAVGVLTLGGFGLAGWVVGRLFRMTAELIDVFVDAAESSARTADLIERQLVPTLGQIARSLERAPVAAPNAEATAIADLRARLDAARQAGDAARVIDCRDALTQHLHGDPLKDLDRAVVRWLAGVIQKRIRAGTVRADVVALAARVADSFGDTAEGAKLRIALPDLRRHAGLCPRCSRPYEGRADACPRCLAPELETQR